MTRHDQKKSDVDIRRADRKLIRKAIGMIHDIEIINPLDFIAILEGKYEK